MKRFLILACIVTGATPVMLFHNAFLHRNQVITCGYHAWRLQHDIKVGSHGWAAYQAYRTANSCSRSLRTKR